MSGPTLVRRAGMAGPRQEWRQPEPEPEVDQADEQPMLPGSRRVCFELPDGFMATISLVPYTEQPVDDQATEAGS